MSERERQSRFERGDDVVVMKFGGTSVEDTSAILRLIGLVERRGEAQPVLVISALAKVTDQLLEAGNAAASGHLGLALAIVRKIYVRHEQLADSLVAGSAFGALDRELRGEFQALESFLNRLAGSGQLDSRLEDELLSYGERFSSQLVTVALAEAGVPAVHVDARHAIITDARHGQASPVWEVTNRRLEESIGPLLRTGMVPVLGGYIASTADGVPTTLGRGGSDFTASIVGAAIGAARVEIWTDVDGVMTADPKLCPDARLIRRMSFDEAAELAHFGAKVLHPATLAPAIERRIPVYVLNSRRPEGEGTEITAQVSSSQGVSAITAKRKVVAVEVTSSRPMDAALLNTVFRAFDDHGCHVDILGSSPGRISLLVNSAEALPEITAVLASVALVRWENHKALICLVGESIRRQPELVSRVFAAVSDMDARVICQGASDRTISFLIEDEKTEETVERLHRIFFPKVEPVRDWGGISTAFCEAG